MDKKNTTIGVTLVLAAIAVLFFAPRSPAPTQPSNAPASAVAGNASIAASSTAAPSDSAYTAPTRDAASSRVVTLANDVAEIRLTSSGGAIRDVALKHFPAVQGETRPYVFNDLHEDPILAFTGFPGLGREATYDVVTSNDHEVVFRTVLDGKLEVTRRYTFTDPTKPNGDIYRLRHETTLRNLTGNTYALPTAALSLGTAEPINSQDVGLNLNVTYYDGSNASYLDRSELAGGGFGRLFGAGKPPLLVLNKPDTVVWAGVKNQFFTAIYTPDSPGSGISVRRVQLPAFRDTQRDNVGISGAALFTLPALAANASYSLQGYLYVGPREYKRLDKFEKHEDLIMQYARGFSKYFLSGIVAPAENRILNLAHSWVGNWGIAVILMTLMLKIVSLPFTLAASRSAKRMAKLQPQMKELREKYKDNPQKQQMATMELFKANKVNPVGGCIPVLITMPLFFGFYSMLSGAAELRFQPFLWAPDLSAPDTIGHIAGFPINIMPLLMGITMIVQMQLTPTPSVDKAQATMMKFMPLMFIAFCYQFSCALALYSTINGLFTIGQQLVINRMKDPGPVGPGTAAATTASAFARPVKNVTPKKKR